MKNNDFVFKYYCLNHKFLLLFFLPMLAWVVGCGSGSVRNSNKHIIVIEDDENRGFKMGWEFDSPELYAVPSQFIAQEDCYGDSLSIKNRSEMRYGWVVIVFDYSERKYYVNCNLNDEIGKIHTELQYRGSRKTITLHGNDAEVITMRRQEGRPAKMIFSDTSSPHRPAV